MTHKEKKNDKIGGDGSSLLPNIGWRMMKKEGWNIGEPLPNCVVHWLPYMCRYYCINAYCASNILSNQSLSLPYYSLYIYSLCFTVGLYAESSLSLSFFSLLARFIFRRKWLNVVRAHAPLAASYGNGNDHWSLLMYCNLFFFWKQ